MPKPTHELLSELKDTLVSRRLMVNINFLRSVVREKVHEPNCGTEGNSKKISANSKLFG